MHTGHVTVTCFSDVIADSLVSDVIISGLSTEASPMATVANGNGALLPAGRSFVAFSVATGGEHDDDTDGNKDGRQHERHEDRASAFEMTQTMSGRVWWGIAKLHLLCVTLTMMMMTDIISRSTTKTRFH